jgi:ribosomal 50S subunit-recycling heat shock protein
MVLVNDVRAKPGKMVKPRDTVRIDFGKRLLTVEITEIPEGQVRKSEASNHYTIISERKVDPRS